jgi:hypothetical protein
MLGGDRAAVFGKKERMKDKGVATVPPSGPLKTAECPLVLECVDSNGLVLVLPPSPSLHLLLFCCAVHSITARHSHSP